MQAYKCLRPNRHRFFWSLYSWKLLPDN